MLAQGRRLTFHFSPLTPAFPAFPAFPALTALLALTIGYGMCGIAGFVGSGTRDVLEAMTHRLAHRGPDGEGFWVSEPSRVFLGHRILAIVDLANGRQPMLTSDQKL